MISLHIFFSRQQLFTHRIVVFLYKYLIFFFLQRWRLLLIKFIVWGTFLVWLLICSFFSDSNHCVWVEDTSKVFRQFGRRSFSSLILFINFFLVQSLQLTSSFCKLKTIVKRHVFLENLQQFNWESVSLHFDTPHSSAARCCCYQKPLIEKRFVWKHYG